MLSSDSVLFVTQEENGVLVNDQHNANMEKDAFNDISNLRSKKSLVLADIYKKVNLCSLSLIITFTIQTMFQLFILCWAMK